MAKANVSISVQDRCTEWVESQHDLSYESHSDTRKRRLAANDSVESVLETESEFDSVSECGGKRRRVGYQSKEEILHLQCEWKDCTFECKTMELFICHVANHIPQLKVKRLPSGSECYVCQWKACTHESDDTTEIATHVNNHAYHTKLKCIGTNHRKRLKFPRCTRDIQTKNTLPPSTSLVCEWDKCSKTFTNYQSYLNHVQTHTGDVPRGKKVVGGVNCKWMGCNGNYATIYKLRDHIRCHTKEKAIACPDCGQMFASTTKFIDHCKRQIPIEVQGFQCTYCNKFYPTENILREHMRCHVFRYKCKYCDMTSESPASLATHIRYRHMTVRPFRCQLCTHAAKTQQDLDSHMTVHTKGPNFFCNFEGCMYKCKNPYMLDRHVEKVHSGESRWYCCHECPIKYRKSYSLTKHLNEAHHLQWPSGHKRFQYAQDEDGYYRLRTVRFECIDDSDEGDEPSDFAASESMDAKKYKLQIDDKSPCLRVEIHASTGHDSDEESSCDQDSHRLKPMIDNSGKSMPLISNILISIDDLDADGNIINSKIVETRETTELPHSEIPPIILKNEQID